MACSAAGAGPPRSLPSSKTPSSRQVEPWFGRFCTATVRVLTCAADDARTAANLRCGICTLRRNAGDGADAARALAADVRAAFSDDARSNARARAVGTAPGARERHHLQRLCRP